MKNCLYKVNFRQVHDSENIYVVATDMGQAEKIGINALTEKRKNRVGGTTDRIVVQEIILVSTEVVVENQV